MKEEPTLTMIHKDIELLPKPPESTEQKTDVQCGQLGDQASSLDNAQPLDLLTFPNPPRNGSNQIPTTIPNIAYLLAKYSVTVQYNVIKKKLEILLPGHSGSTDNLDNVSMTYLISLAALNGLSIGQIPAYVEVLADRNIYNPVAAWIASKPWDEIDRLPAIYDTVTSHEDYPAVLKRILIYKWLLSAVAAAIKPSGFKARGVLTFQGPQGIGKTSWIISLVPDWIRWWGLNGVQRYFFLHGRLNIFFEFSGVNAFVTAKAIL